MAVGDGTRLNPAFEGDIIEAALTLNLSTATVTQIVFKKPNGARVEKMATFVTDGSENGKRYGAQGQGTGRMPGFGQVYTEEQIQAVVDYERGL